MDKTVNRADLIAEFAKRRQGKDARFGKTAAQKFAFLLQEVYGVNLGYRFSLYTYGPYDSAVMSDIDDAISRKLVQSEFDLDRGYDITPGTPDEASSLPDDLKEPLDEVFKHFGKSTARELEMYSTLVLIGQQEQTVDESTLIRLFRKVKPRFTEDVLQRAIGHLTDIQVFDKAGVSLTD